ncbi:MAG: glycerol-3-phosphate dehydrogenase/oxidase [Acidimicrobiia bacterium]|nr:glycerol-3-phosphate dehydrogenase/oxidase [Acidimicrobiia bacterium]
MNRDEATTQIAASDVWDVVIIGGGATGLGAAVEASSRGYRTLLVEQSDFAKGTSSRSTKLVHGGVRYLKQGNVSLVLEALKERGRLIHNAPHLVKNLPFIVPRYDWWEGPFYGVGLRVYDMLAGKLGLGPSRNLDVGETLELIPTLEPDGLRGGTVYHDGQFDDARLAITLALTAVDHGAVVANHVRVAGLVKTSGLVAGVIAQDVESGAEYTIMARVVVNATGVFVDDIIAMDQPGAKPMLQPSQGVHLVLPRSFQPGEAAIMVPKTDDGRVLFAVPWLDRVVVGTTDTPIDTTSLEPRALPEEIEFLLTHAARYLTHDPDPDDVLSVYAGLRPLVRVDNEDLTSELSRDHTVVIGSSGLVTVTGGKWTTYRKMGEDVIDRAIAVGGLEERPSVTESLHLHGYVDDHDTLGVGLSEYGSDASTIREIIAMDESLGDLLHPRLPYVGAEIVWATRSEMARTVEDVLARRTRSLLLDARASAEIAPRAAALMATELGEDQTWENDQVATYRLLAREYVLV